MISPDVPFSDRMAGNMEQLDTLAFCDDRADPLAGPFTPDVSVNTYYKSINPSSTGLHWPILFSSLFLLLVSGARVCLCVSVCVCVCVHEFQVTGVF